MERFTISIDDDLARELERFMQAKGYRNRSEAVRDMLRAGLDEFRIASGATQSCVGVLSYVYNHHARELAQKVMRRAHGQHELVVSSMHPHHDHDNCDETMILSGPTDRVQRFAGAFLAEPGIRHGKLNVIPVETESKELRKHTHYRPVT